MDRRRPGDPVIDEAAAPLVESVIPGLELLHRGKVRDVWAIDDRHLLMVATDRLSAFDVVLPDPVPGKGAVLTRISNFWFRHLGHLCATHLCDVPVAAVIDDAGLRRRLGDRATVVRRLRPLPVEAVARGHLAGSGWKDYQAHGSVCGVTLPTGLRQSERLPQPIFTPATKAAVGEHDENVDFAAVIEVLGRSLAEEVRNTTLAVYAAACAHAAPRGIVVADTKLEFGLDAAGRLVWMDEALTPDSSRFWPATGWEPGSSPPSWDKQYVRDHLERIGWDKRPPAPRLPAEVISRTAAKYREAERLLTGAG